MKEFDLYEPRQIDFSGLTIIGDWSIKVYTITLNEHFSSPKIQNTVMNSLDILLRKPKASVLPVHHNAFLIMHEAREGVWVLFSWWTGGEMLETEVRFVSFEQPTLLKPTPHDGHLICVWELEVVQHERAAWINYVLMNPRQPDFLKYQTDTL